MHILLKKENRDKGILIITHKEIPYIQNKLEYLKDYYIISHSGSIAPVIEQKWISLYMVADSRCHGDKYIPFTSRNFLHSSFHKREEEKTIDFIYVSRCNELKETIQILKQFKKSEKKCVMIILKQNSEDPYYKKFLKIDKGNVIVIDTHNIEIKNDIFMGFPSEQLSKYYNSAKIYIHASEFEGESRSIQEALSCGCLVMAKKDMKGGGLDYLNEQNSVLYTRKNISEKMEQAYQKDYKYDPDILQKTNEIYTRPKFRKLLEQKLDMYLDDCNMENLMFSLPGHNLSVSWYLKGEMTADIKSDQQFSTFLNEI